MDHPDWLELLIERLCQRSGIGIFPIGKSVITSDEYDFLLYASPFLRRVILSRLALEVSHKIIIERRCPHCLKVEGHEYSTSYLPQVIKLDNENNNRMVCSECIKQRIKIEEEEKKASGFYERERERKAIEKKRRLEEKIKEQLENNKRIFQKTEEFISKYLQEGDFIEKSHRNYQEVSYALYGTDLRLIKSVILKMPYKVFLNTPYWKALSRKVLFTASYRCQVCGNKGILNCHHRTYENHGDEYNHLNDLICLCTQCHNKFHVEKSQPQYIDPDDLPF